MTDLYTLKGREVVKCDDLLEWARWMETAARVIAKDRAGEYLVSTVFLGLDHRLTAFGDEAGPPLIFETMTFPVDNNCILRRYSTYEQALIGHNEVLYSLGSDNVTEVEIEDGQIKRKYHSGR